MILWYNKEKVVTGMKKAMYKAMLAGVEFTSVGNRILFDYKRGTYCLDIDNSCINLYKFSDNLQKVFVEPVFDISMWDVHDHVFVHTKSYLLLVCNVDVDRSIAFCFDSGLNIIWSGDGTKFSYLFNSNIRAIHKSVISCIKDNRMSNEEVAQCIGDFGELLLKDGSLVLSLEDGSEFVVGQCESYHFEYLGDGSLSVVFDSGEIKQFPVPKWGC